MIQHFIYFYIYDNIHTEHVINNSATPITAHVTVKEQFFLQNFSRISGSTDFQEHL